MKKRLNKCFYTVPESKKRRSMEVSVPSTGFEWTEEGREKLTLKIWEETQQRIVFKTNKNCVYGDFSKIESEKIFIAPTAMLQHDGHVHTYGVFAKTDFPKSLHYPYNLGEYQGTVTQITEKNSQPHLYTFNLGNGYELNAEKEGSWCRMINSASSEETANIFYDRGMGNKIHCFLKGPIQAGQQLLGFYGDGYKFAEKRFLHASDSWQSSSDIYRSNIDRYCDNNEDAIDCVIPNIYHLDARTINLPILTKSADGTFLPQSKQENKTLLHHACETGNILLLEEVLKHEPDLNIQTRISGETALHLLLRNTQLTIEEKRQFCELLLLPISSQSQSLSEVKDIHDESILELVLNQKQCDLAQFIFDVDYKKNKHKSTKSFFGGERLQYLFVALKTGSLSVLNAITKYIKKQDVIEVIERKSDELERVWHTLRTQCSAETLQHMQTFLCGFLDAQKDAGLLEKLNIYLWIDRHIEMETVSSALLENNKVFVINDFDIVEVSTGEICVMIDECWVQLQKIYDEISKEQTSVNQALSNALLYLGAIKIEAQRMSPSEQYFYYKNSEANTSSEEHVVLSHQLKIKAILASLHDVQQSMVCHSTIVTSHFNTVIAELNKVKSAMTLDLSSYPQFGLFGSLEVVAPIPSYNEEPFKLHSPSI